MNEVKLSNTKNRSLHNDKRSTFQSVIDEQILSARSNNDQEAEVAFLLKALPFIRKYNEPIINSSMVLVSEEENTNTFNNNNSTTIVSYVQTHNKHKKGEVYREFMKECMNEIYEDEESLYSKISDEEIFCCSVCRSEMIYIHSESSLVCQSCANSTDYQDFMINVPYNSDVEILSQFAYKRINHFREWLTQIQAKESTMIPKDVLINVMKEMKKERLETHELTNTKIKMYLKKIGMSKYYEHVPIIINKICGTTPPKISNEIEQILIEMFKQIQTPFERHCPKNRKNFLSYSYTLHKMCQLIEQHDLLIYFPLLKSREKLYLQDQIWKGICNDLQWTFIPSL